MPIRIVYSSTPTISPGITVSGPMTFTMSSDRLVGRDTAGSGASEELTVGGGVEFTGSGGIQRSALSGDVSAAAGSGTTAIGADKVLTAMIANDQVTYAKIQNVTDARVLGRAAGSAGDVQELTGASQIFIDSGTITTRMATSRLLGRTTAGSGVAEELQVTSPLAMAGGAVTVTQAAIDHGSIGGLADDDHTIYFLADGTRAISGPLDHNGTTVGLYNVTPVTQAADMVALTDSTGGTANSTLVDVTTAGLADPVKCNDNFADIAAKVNAIRTALRNIGIMA